MNFFLPSILSKTLHKMKKIYKGDHFNSLCAKEFIDQVQQKPFVEHHIGPSFFYLLSEIYNEEERCHWTFSTPWHHELLLPSTYLLQFHSIYSFFFKKIKKLTTCFCNCQMSWTRIRTGGYSKFKVSGVDVHYWFTVARGIGVVLLKNEQ